jgi:hypothetical protein
MLQFEWELRFLRFAAGSGLMMGAKGRQANNAQRGR